MPRVLAATMVAFFVATNAVYQEQSGPPEGELPAKVKELIERSAEQRLKRIDALRKTLGELREELRAVSKDRDLSRKQRVEDREEIKEKIRATLDELESLRLNRPPFLATLRGDTLKVGQIGRMPSDLVGAAAEKRFEEGRRGAAVRLQYEVVQVLGPRDGVIRILKLYDNGDLGHERGETLWMRGISTKDWSKGQRLELDDAMGVFQVLGTGTYRTANGADREVTVVEKYDVRPWLKYFPAGEKQ